MDAIWIILLFLFLIIGAPLLKAFLNAKARQLGENAGTSFAAKQLPKALAALGVTLRLHTSAEAAEQIIDTAIAAKPKKYTKIAPWTYTMEAIEKDDVTLQVVGVDGGVELRIVRVKEQMGFPQGAPFWPDLRKLITDQASARGVAVTEGVVSFARTQPIDDRNWVWTVTA